MLCDIYKRDFLFFKLSRLFIPLFKGNNIIIINNMWEYVYLSSAIENENLVI